MPRSESILTSVFPFVPPESGREDIDRAEHRQVKTGHRVHQGTDFSSSRAKFFGHLPRGHPQL